MGKLLRFVGMMENYCRVHGLKLPRPLVMPPGVIRDLQAELEETGPMVDAPDQVNDSPYPGTVGKVGQLWIVEDPRMPTKPADVCGANIALAFHERIRRSRG